MPCNSDYMEPDEFEINASIVCGVITEIENPDEDLDWPRWSQGLHPTSYNKGIGQDFLDSLVAYACAELRMFSQNHLQRMSLELQIWWRDHKKADATRIAEESKLRICPMCKREIGDEGGIK